MTEPGLSGDFRVRAVRPDGVLVCVRWRWWHTAGDRVRQWWRAARGRIEP